MSLIFFFQIPPCDLFVMCRVVQDSICFKFFVKRTIFPSLLKNSHTYNISKRIIRFLGELTEL